MEVFKALLWKHWKEQYRSICHNLWELLSSLIIFIILVTAKILHSNARTSFDLEDIFGSENSAYIVYTPANKLTWTLMSPICYDHTKISPANDSRVICQPMKYEELINNFMTKFNTSSMSSVTGMVFHNLNGSQFPKELNYSMKHMDMQQKRSVSNLEEVYGRYIDDVPDYRVQDSKFLANLQWTIDKTFLSQFTKYPIDHEIKLHDVNDYMPLEMRVAHNFLMLCTVLAPLPYFLDKCAAFVEEKRTGSNEMLKLSGVSMHYIRLSQVLVYSIIGALRSCIITLVLKFLSISQTHAILPQSNAFIIWITLNMHILIVTLLAFVVSTLSQSHQNSDSLAILMYMCLVLFKSLLYGQKFRNLALKTFVYTLLPQAPFLLFWDEVFFLEETSDGSQFDNIWPMHSENQCASVPAVWAMLSVQLIFLTLLSQYLDVITPGRYGTSVKWNYFLKASYWRKKNRPHVHFHVTAEHEVPKDSRYFEVVPASAKIAIKIVNVTKVFKSFGETVTALNNLNLDIYKGEITVVLGTNGAGKSTLMSIITGLYTATSGLVYVSGLDNSARIQECRKFLGYCPQQDFIFDYLTVKESILFFELIRKEPEETREVNALSLIKHFQLADVAAQYGSQIATGKKRCLQIACALMGNAKILVLDEPTTGLDYEMQHALWNLLLKFRGKKTILLSTTDMDEADALGDRIAVINKGHLKCNGSPIFLKNAMGTDFKVVLKLRDGNKFDDVEVALHNTFLGKSHTITIKTLTATKMSISMPASEREVFPKVFDVLEAQREQLGIETMHVGMSLEHVFLRFIEEDDEITSYYSDELEEEYETLKGWPLRRSQMRWLIIRVFNFIKVHKYEFGFLQIVVPLVALITVTVSCNMHKKASPHTDDEPNKTILIEDNFLFARAGKQLPLTRMFPNVDFAPSNDVKRDLNLLPKPKLVGWKMKEDHTDIYYRSFLSPESLNIYSNLFMMTMPTPPTSRIHMTYTSLSNKTSITLTLPKNLHFCYMWSMWVGFLAILPLAPLILLCIYEYHRGVRFNHQMTGCPPYILWLSKLLAHMAIYTAIVPTAVLICTVVLDFDSTLCRPVFLFALFLLLMAFGPAFLLYWYVFSFAMNQDKPIAKIYTLSICFGLVTPIFVFFVTQLEVVSKIRMLIWLILVLGHTLPTFTFSKALISLTTKAHHNALCLLNYDLCPDKMISRLFMSREMCCESDGEPFGYFNDFAELYILIGQSIILWIILILLQRRWIHNKAETLCNLMYKPPKQDDGKSFARVRAEEEFVTCKMAAFKKQTLEERQKTQHVVLVKNVHKRFNCKRPVIENISLSCKRGQCLVILGKGSAGKSVLLQLISGYICMTRGDSCVNGYFKNTLKYIPEIAYVGRYGLDDFLTGYSNVEMLAALHGYQKHDAKRLAMRYLRFIGLTAYSNVLFESYSPGCCTRLAMCLALIGSFKAVLLDEPYHLVDPHKRQLVTRAIHHLCHNDTACIVSETSIEWRLLSEFANKLALLDKGKIVALGTAEEIRNEWGSGYTAQIKLKVDAAFHVEVAKSPSTLAHKYSMAAVQELTVHELKEAFADKFPTAVLIEEYLSILKYRIRDPDRTIKYSEMFSILETLKAEFSLIEDYTLSEVSVLEILTQLQTRGLETRTPLNL